MRKRKLAWILAMAMTVTSVDSTALAVGAADFASEEAGFAAEDFGESAAVQEAAASESAVQEAAGESEQSQTGSDQENASEAGQEQDGSVQGNSGEAGQEQDSSSQENADTVDLIPNDSSLADQDAEEFGFGDGIDGFVSEEEGFGSEETLQDVDSTEALEAVMAGAVEYPSLHTQLVTDMNFDAVIETEGEYAWFSFTPQEDGEYIFLSEAKVGTKAELYSASEDQQLTELAASTGYNGNNVRNFRLSYSLSKGVTYFYRVGFYNKYNTGTYPVRVFKNSADYQITGVALNIGTARSRYVGSSEYAFADGAVLTISYANGQAQDYTVADKIPEFMDDYGHEIAYYYYDNDNVISGGGGHQLSEGTYQVRFQVEGYTPENVDALSYQIIVGDPWEEMKEGITTVKSVYYGDDALWYKFVPEKSGTYTIDYPSQIDLKEKETNVMVNYNKRWGQYSGKGQYRGWFYLEKDKTYYVRFWGMNESQGATADITVARIPEVTGIQITNVSGDGIADLSSYTAIGFSATFDNDTEKTGELFYGDTRGTIDDINFYPYLIDQDGKEHELLEALPAGNYSLVIKSGNQVSSGVNYVVKDLEDTGYYKGELSCGKALAVSSPSREDAFYSFSASETESYTISNITSKYFDILRKTENGYESIKDSGENGNGTYTWALEAGSKIYFQFSGKNRNDGSENASLDLEKRQNITGMSFPSTSFVLPELGFGVGRDMPLPEKMTVTYSDGSSRDILAVYGDALLKDDLGNTIDMNWLYKESDGTFREYDWDANEGNMIAGNYQVVFTAGEVRLEQPISIVSINEEGAARFPQLSCGKHQLELRKGQANNYIFAPEKDGYYGFRYSQSGLNAYLYLWDEENKMVSHEGDLSERRELKAGSKYLINLWPDESQTLNLEIYREPEAESVEIISGGEDGTTFIENLDYIGFYNLQVKVTLDNGEEEILSDGEEDNYGKYLRFGLYQQLEDGSLGSNRIEDMSRVPAGEYVYKAFYGEKESNNGIPVTVIPLKDAESLVLEADGEQNFSMDAEAVLCKFSPTESGEYEIWVNAVVGIDVIDENGEDQGWLDNRFQNMYMNFEAGKTYYLQVIRQSESNVDVQIQIRKTDLPVKLEATLLEDTGYIPGVDRYSDIKIKTVATYSDGRTQTVKSGDQIGRYQVYYETIVEGSGYDYEGPVKAGTFTITPILAKNGNWIRNLSNSVTGTVEMPVITDTLALDQWTEIKETYRQLFQFTAEKDGDYKVETESGAEGTLCIVKDGKLNRRGSEITLTKGESCVVLVSAYKDSKIRVVEKTEEQPDQPTPGKEYKLTDGFQEHVAVETAGQQLVFTFTPETDGDYVIRSEGNADTYVTLYYQGNRLDSDDQSGGGDNFSLRRHLEAGKTYVYQVRLYSENAIGDFTVFFNLVGYKEIKGLELVLKDGKKASDLNVLMPVGEVYQVKVIYLDDSSKLYEIKTTDSSYEFSDEYENRVRVSVGRKVNGDPESENLTVQCHLEYRNDTDWSWEEVGEKTLPAQGMDSVESLEPGKARSVSLNSGEYVTYSFRVSEAGYYRLKYPSGGGTTYLLADWKLCETYRYNGETYLEMMDTNTDEDGIIWLEKDMLCRIILQNMGESQEKIDISVEKAKALKKIEVKKAPDEQVIYKGMEYAYDLEGLVITAYYADGSSEDIRYGELDSSGRRIQLVRSGWGNEDTYRIIVALGNSRAVVNIKAGSTEQLPLVKTGEKMEFTTSETNMLAIKYSPEESGYYTVDVENGELQGITEEVTGNNVSWSRNHYLEAGKVYDIVIRKYEENASVTVLRGVCEWEIIQNIPVSCTQDGSITEECKVHNHRRTYPTQKAFGHDFSDWKVTKEPSCGVTGEKQRTCYECELVEKETLPASTHQFGPWTTTRQPGCETAGEQQRSCTRCKAVEKKSIPAKGQHSFSQWKVTKEATVLEAGTQERSCSQCGKKETASIAKLKSTISLSVSGTIPLKVKQTYQVKVTMGKGDKVVSWKSSNPKAISVKNGKIKGLKSGKKATITVRLKSGKKASFKVKVQKAAVATTKLTVTNSATGKKVGKSYTMKRGKTLKLAVKVAPVTSKQKVTYSSSNKKILTVTKKGVIKAKKKGTATITVRSGKKKYSIKIKVK